MLVTSTNDSECPPAAPDSPYPEPPPPPPVHLTQIRLIPLGLFHVVLELYTDIEFGAPPPPDTFCHDIDDPLV